MNKNARTECLETLLNESELNRFENLAAMLGIPKSTLNRSLINREVQRHGMAPPPARESRGCRGVGRLASRASASLSMRRTV
jgi:predicted transcriptional regulator